MGGKHSKNHRHLINGTEIDQAKFKMMIKEGYKESDLVCRENRDEDDDLYENGLPQVVIENENNEDASVKVRMSMDFDNMQIDHSYAESSRVHSKDNYTNRFQSFRSGDNSQSISKDMDDTMNMSADRKGLKATLPFSRNTMALQRGKTENNLHAMSVSPAYNRQSEFALKKKSVVQQMGFNCSLFGEQPKENLNVKEKKKRYQELLKKETKKELVAFEKKKSQ